MSKKLASFVAFHFVEQRVKEKWSSHSVSGGGAPCPKITALYMPLTWGKDDT